MLNPDSKNHYITAQLLSYPTISINESLTFGGLFGQLDVGSGRVRRSPLSLHGREYYYHGREWREETTLLPPATQISWKYAERSEYRECLVNFSFIRCLTKAFLLIFTQECEKKAREGEKTEEQCNQPRSSKKEKILQPQEEGGIPLISWQYDRV